MFEYLEADVRGDAALKRWWDAHDDNKKNQKKPGVGNEVLKYFKMWRNYEVQAANRPDKPVPDPAQQETQVLIINEPLEERSVHETYVTPIPTFLGVRRACFQPVLST